MPSNTHLKIVIKIEVMFIMFVMHTLLSTNSLCSVRNQQGPTWAYPVYDLILPILTTTNCTSGPGCINQSALFCASILSATVCDFLCGVRSSSARLTLGKKKNIFCPTL